MTLHRRPRIYCFGCSFTEGTKNSNWQSYVQHLAELLPDYDVYNYGVGGTSELFHTHLMNTLPDKIKQDIIIFQVTSMGRLTWWTNQNYHEMVIQRSQNIWKLSGNLLSKHIGRITYGTLDNLTDKTYKFAKKYYSTVTLEQATEQYRVNSFYANHVADYTFFHRRLILKDTNYDSFQDSITENEWNKYIFDDSGHLNKLGSEQQAKWVYDNLKKKNLIN